MRDTERECVSVYEREREERASKGERPSKKTYQNTFLLLRRVSVRGPCSKVEWGS